jgi:hypothetical protein
MLRPRRHVIVYGWEVPAKTTLTGRDPPPGRRSPLGLAVRPSHLPIENDGHLALRKRHVPNSRPGTRIFLMTMEVMTRFWPIH